MKNFKSLSLLEELQADVRTLIAIATLLKEEDPEMLLTSPTPGNWNVIQILSHLNSYDLFYLTVIEKSLNLDKNNKEFFKPGWLGNYFTKMMEPGENGKITNRMQSPKNHRPEKELDAFPVMTTFFEQQKYLLDLLEMAKKKDIGTIRVPISISRFIKLKLGDTFRFLIAHKQRHFLQIENTIAAVNEIKGKYLVGHQVK